MKYDQDIEQLLPWYVKDLLSNEDKARVEGYLADHPQMRAQLLLIEEEEGAVQQVHDALGGPRPGGLDSLMARIDMEEAQKAPLKAEIGKAGAGLKGWFGAFLDGLSRPALQMAGVAAAVVVVAQAAIIGGLVYGERDGSSSGQQVVAVQQQAVKAPGSFKTASGKQSGSIQQDGSKFLIAFGKEAKISDVSKLLKSHGASILSGPKAGGMYEIFVAKSKLPEDGPKGLVKKLGQDKNLVRFVSIAK